MMILSNLVQAKSTQNHYLHTALTMRLPVGHNHKKHQSPEVNIDYLILLIRSQFAPAAQQK